MSEREIPPVKLAAPTAAGASGNVPWRWLPVARGPALPLDLVRIRLGAVFEREMEAGRGFLWLPVLLGAGIVVYFALPREPSLTALLVLAAALAGAASWVRPRPALFRTLVGLAAVAAGASLMKVRTDTVAAPVLAREMTVSVSGWIAEIEAAARGGVRVVLRVHRIDTLAPAETPETVRVTVRTRTGGLAVGDAISLKARLAPPSGPVMPGGYDFARTAFYERIGAVGFAYGAAQPAEIGGPPLAIRLAEPFARLRAAIRARVLETLPGDNGEIAAALIMGDQGGISESAQDDMRASGLGHVLSISGLHMALVAGSAFWLIRALLALSPGLALRQPIKKWAAAAALAVAAFYLAISGLGVATERAFIMLAVMLVAVLIDRRALTLRNVALAALIVLVIEPESLLTPSFQMSFAATLALVAGYEALAARADRRLALADNRGHGLLNRAWLWAGSLFLTSLIAGIATTPFAIFHFQRAAPLALVANMAAMPVIGLVVMPMALLTVVLMPLGLDPLALEPMSLGIDWMVAVAHATAAWSEGWGTVQMPPHASLVLFSLGFLWLALWATRWRLAGLVPIVVAIPIALAVPRPDILVDESGEAAAIRGGDGRLQFIGARGHTFEVENWLRADGDPRPAPTADDRVRCDTLGCVAALENTGELVALANRPAAFTDDCALAAVVISRYRAPAGCADAAATVIDRTALAAGGAQALYLIRSDETGDRPRFTIETAYPALRRPYMPPIAGSRQ